MAQPSNTEVHTGDEVVKALREVHAEEWCEHQGLEIIQEIVHFGYYLPTVEADYVSFA